MGTLVSAVIPTYNYGRFVERAVRSVLQQPYANIECIVVDDGSQDDTPDVLRQFGRDIRVIRQENQGLSAARNTGIAAARGAFIAFLDADDEWMPAKVAQQVELLSSRDDLGCVGCGREHRDADGRIDRIPGEVNQGSHADTLRRIALRRFWVGGSGSGAMVRATLLQKVGGFDTALRAAEDWDMWLRVAAVSAIDNVPGVLTAIYRHGTGTFRNVDRMQQNQCAVYQKAIAAWPHLLTRADRRQMRALILADAAGECLGLGDARRALTYYGRSLREWPFSRRRSMAALKVGARLAVS